MELNPTDYYRIDWDALDQLSPAEKMEALAKIFEQVRADIGAERGRMAHQAHAHHGTKKAAAEHLGLSPARFGQIYREVMIEIPTAIGSYPLLDEIEDRFPSRQEAHDAIQTYLGQIIEIDGEEEVVLERKPLKNASGRVIGETLWVTKDAAETIRESIDAAASE
ncbi:hypothetical protein [Nocardiopsis sp. L17-MgMaSL7]|uniref:hypothetical protein n=1 Tax=Nocardiopsis sp. L17-MgMaSL7 TaxID=1938893 RepID=UPI000D70B801|nr:hypothetical protein [Nocardiopsis sp. L17-MgMaSL7]PWV44578.1 hypothetical protein BDW27_12337 [Nocardiopsis sp. L17-MgMaSL7]